MAKRLSKKSNLKHWKKGINNNKNVNNPTYERNTRGGIRLTANS